MNAKGSEGRLENHCAVKMVKDTARWTRQCLRATL